MIIKYFVGTEGTATDTMSEFRVTGGTRTGDTMAFQFKPVRGLTRTGDTITIQDCRIIPGSRAWPLFWTAGMSFALITAIFELARGNIMAAVIPMLAALGLLIWLQDVKRRFRHPLVSHPNGYIQPETDQEAALFASCKTLSVRDYIRGFKHKLDAWMPSKRATR